MPQVPTGTRLILLVAGQTPLRDRQGESPALDNNAFICKQFAREHHARAGMARIVTNYKNSVAM